MSACAIIVTYRTGPALESCLAALMRAQGLDEIIVADNGNPASEEAELDALAAADARLGVVRGQGNVGFAAACNLAARQTRADVLVFVNPDVILEPHAVAALTAALEAAPPPALIGGDLRDEAGRPERGGRRDRLTLWRAFVSFSGLSRLERSVPLLRDFNRHTDPLPSGPQSVGAISGALVAMRRADFERLGGFDERYFLHVEDVDLCRRAQDAGWPVLFVPGPHGVHVRSTSDVDPREIARHKAQSMSRYFAKFAHGPIERAAAALAGAFLLALTPRN